MNVAEALSRLQLQASRDEKLQSRFLKTREDPYPLRAFCDLCRELGYEIYPMDVIAASEENYAAMKRSTNGGGENSPHLKAAHEAVETRKPRKR